MVHKNYYEISAKDNFEAGLILGTEFAAAAREAIDFEAQKEGWGRKVDWSKQYLEAADRYFPQYVSELKGYAKGADLDFPELWTRSLEDEFEISPPEKCTTAVTNSGLALAHNEDEDFGQDLARSICVLKKTIAGKKIFELYYYHTLGGNAVSINSNGYLQFVNSLDSRDTRVGIPRNVIGRWLSETGDPEADYKTLSVLPRSSGFNHVIANTQGRIRNIETSATEQTLSYPAAPFVHTNHYLSALKSFEANFKKGTRERYDAARALIKSEMSEEQLKEAMDDVSRGEENSIMNKNTIAKIIVNLKDAMARVWLKREEDVGWVDYELDFLV